MWIKIIFLITCYSYVCGLPALPKVMQMMLGNDGNITNRRYAILNSYTATGVRNVRWETMPNNMMDQNGKPVPQRMHGSSGEFGCLDVQGKQQSNGAEYTRPSGKFKYRCNDGVEEVVACKTSKRAGEQWIKVGETVNTNGFWHKCETYPNSSVIYTQENSCTYNGKDYHAGEEVRIGFLRMECQNDGYKAIGCYYVDENNNQVPLEKGQKKEAGKVTHMCDDKNGNLQYSNTARGCTKNGKDYNEGDEFKQNHLKYKCENGIVNILGCYVDEHKDLAIGQDDIDNDSHMIRRCYRNGGAIEYFEHPCGSSSSPCKPDPIPETPNDAPLLAPGLKAPGYGTFALVQTMGGNMAANPETIKLELDKILAGIRH
ncbi:hypothetical protein FO519_006640 [Halicephalobus sp. NKZ332]|nr:hypothetical protein FO519_006640 [Halicephalobus sp. NKZ332]